MNGQRVLALLYSSHITDIFCLWNLENFFYVYFAYMSIVELHERATDVDPYHRSRGVAEQIAGVESDHKVGGLQNKAQVQDKSGPAGARHAT